MNVPTGVELPSELEIKIYSSSNFSVAQGNATVTNGTSNDNCHIPKFLCDNYVAFVFTASTDSSWRYAAKNKNITPGVRYTIADYVTSTGELNIAMIYGRISQGSGAGWSNTYTIKLLKS